MKSFVNNEKYKESINVDTINELIYSLYNLLKGYSDKHYKGYFFGYFKIEGLESKFEEAYDCLVNLENQKFRIQQKSCCECLVDVGLLIERVKILTGSYSNIRIDLIEDTSNLDQWTLANPDRVVREVWEQCLYSKCNKLTYTLSKELNAKDTSCKLVYKLVKELNDCSFTYDVKRYQHNCEMDYNIVRTQTTCDISYNDFIVFHNCGGSVKLIKTLTDCGVKVGVDPISKCLELNYNLKKYPINC